MSGKYKDYSKKSSITKEDVSNLDFLVKEHEKAISKLFIEAVNNFDREKILEIAETVWRLRGFFKGGFKEDKFQDLERFNLALLKAFGKKWTARQVAIHITGNENPTKEKIDSIRDKGRAMGFQFAIERKIRRK